MGNENSAPPSPLPRRANGGVLGGGISFRRATARVKLKENVYSKYRIFITFVFFITYIEL